jgi:DNA replication protein DnaD
MITDEEQKQDVDGLQPREETGDEIWERLFREMTPEQWERLTKMFDADEAEA